MRRAIESGATASGGETMAPSTKPTGQAKPNNQWVAAATATVVKRRTYGQQRDRAQIESELAPAHRDRGE